MTDPFEDLMRVLPGELAPIGRAARIGAVEITGDRDRRLSDDRTRIKLALEAVVLRVARGEADAPAVVVYHDRHMIGILVRRRGAVEGRIVEAPFRRLERPDQLVEIVGVPCVAEQAAL